MSHIATLISNPRLPSLTPELIAAASACLPHANSAVHLDDGIAADLPFTPARTDADLRALADSVRGKIASAPVDVVIQSAAGRRKRLFLADMDSTLIGQECIDELADHVAMKPRITAITERAMRGEIEFELALRERVALLKNIPISILGEVIEKRITLTPGGRAAVATMRANGAYCCLVSGGFTHFTEKVAADLGFDEQHGNRLTVEDGKIVGVEEPVLGRDAKLRMLQTLTARLKLKREDSLAVGDGANDLQMIEAAGIGVAFRAKPLIAAAADARIDHGDLTALLYLQGYKREEFVE